MSPGTLELKGFHKRKLILGGDIGGQHIPLFDDCPTATLT